MGKVGSGGEIRYGGVVVRGVGSPRGEEYSAGFVVDADGVVAEEVHSQNAVETSAFVKVKVYDCYCKV